MFGNRMSSISDYPMQVSGANTVNSAAHSGLYLYP